MSTNLTPAQQIEAQLTQAAWEAYEEERERHLDILRNPDKTGIQQGSYIKSSHGTRSRYRIGCRCTSCKRANREYMEEYRRKQGVQPRGRSPKVRKWEREYSRARYNYYKEHPDEIPKNILHGTTTGYSKYACRCDDCRRFMREKSRARRARAKEES